jgi:hypothetical protein
MVKFGKGKSANLVLGIALVLAILAPGGAQAGSILTQSQLNTELGTSCAAQGKPAPCITPSQMSDLVLSAAPRGVSAAVVAAGATQGTATALSGQISDVTTVPAGSGVVLPAAVAGQQNLVCNDGVNQLLVYPASGATIGALATNAPQTVLPGQCAEFAATSATLWKVRFAGPAALPAGFYVSPSGLDSNAGTLAAPFLTLGKCQTAMQGSLNKVCYLRAGTYSMAAGLTLGYVDQGETWSYYPPDGLNSATLTQTSPFIFFTLNTGADQVTITGLSATGSTGHSTHAGCGLAGESIFLGGGGGAANNAGPANLTLTYNILTSFDCGISISEAANPVISFNQTSLTEYLAINCNHCTGVSTQTIWQGNIIYDLNAAGTDSQNTYGITFSTTANGTSSNFTATNNKVINSLTWTCFDSHGGTNIYWFNNLCVRPGNYTGWNGVTGGFSNTNTLMIGNVVDNGANGTTVLTDSFVNCGLAGCSSNTGITGGVVQNNTVLFGSSNGTIIATSPNVTVSGNVGNLNPEQVSSITFQSGGSSASFTHGVPNGVVATLAVNMSNSYWGFPIPPGVLSIGGANSGGFAICNQNQLCQSAAGTPAGTYTDVSITATLHGMYQSPFTAAAGTLTLTGN